MKTSNTTKKLRNELDEGEADAITIACEIGADLLLIDEALGRKIAHQEGLRITGILGVLLDAKNQGLISHVKPLYGCPYFQCEF